MSDLISRQAAIDALLGITAMRNTIPLDSAIFNIKKLPSVQPERKTGQWVLRRVTYLWEGVECEKFETRCSCCERLAISGIKSTYCPNCGADMRGEENETN